MASLPHLDEVGRVAFYNVGLQVAQLEGQHRRTWFNRLKADVIKVFSELHCDVLCLSEMGEVQVGLESAFARAERKQRERGTSIEQRVKKKAAGTRTRRAARDEDQIALELAEAESRREALEEGAAAAPASTAPMARTLQPEPDEEGMPDPGSLRRWFEGALQEVQAGDWGIYPRGHYVTLVRPDAGIEVEKEEEVNIYPAQDFRVAQVLRCFTRTVPVVKCGAPRKKAATTAAAPATTAAAATAA